MSIHPPATVATPAPAAPADGPPPVRLMLADDHRMLREGLRRSMTEQGFSVVGEAADGAQAVDLAHRLQPEVILMDVTMPELDGVGATR